MRAEEFVFCLLVLLAIASISLTSAQQEYGPIIMNASISQPICIQISDALSQGIFFTNKSTIYFQYPITDMTSENNATGNYNGTSFGTLYNVTACPGNTINVSVYQSACDNLKNGTNTINLYYDAGDGGQGGFIGNATTATGFSAESTYFVQGYSMLVDNYRLVAERIWPVAGKESIFLRYWLDPWPNSAPTGIYNTTFKIRGAEIGTSPGSGSC